jgi:hypothetical protein
MAEYGKFVNGDSTISKMHVYNFFVYYFDNPRLKKIGNVNNGFVLYGCRVPTTLRVSSKYIFASIESKNAPLNDEITLDQIDWKSLQMRTLNESYNVPFHAYTQKTDEYS